MGSNPIPPTIKLYLMDYLMNLNCLKRLPTHVGIALSGGIDSVVMFDVALSLGRKVTIFTFDHKLENSEEEVNFAIELGKTHGCEVKIGQASLEVPKGQSKEAFWSTERNNWFNEFEMFIATGHHLNDVAEWYLMTMATGNGGHYMRYSNQNVVRPLIVTPRAKIEEYAASKNLQYLTDETNNDVTFNKRNRVRHNLLPEVLDVNPGFLTSIKNNILRKEFPGTRFED